MNLRFSGESSQAIKENGGESFQERESSTPSAFVTRPDTGSRFVVVSFNSDLKKFEPIDLAKEFDIEKFQQSFVDAVEQAKQVLSKEEIHDYMMRICTLFHLPTDLLQLSPEELGQVIVRNPYESTKPDLLSKMESEIADSEDSFDEEELSL